MCLTESILIFLLSLSLSLSILVELCPGIFLSKMIKNWRFKTKYTSSIFFEYRTIFSLAVELSEETKREVGR
jgi:hypothetical protein